MWKGIGYTDICYDVNDLVIQGGLLILFPPTKTDNWICPNVDMVTSRLKDLIDLGFKLTVPVMSDAYHIFESRLEIIGDTLTESFGNVCNESGATIASNCLGEVIKPEKNLKKQDVLHFLYSKIHQNNKEEVIMKILDMHKVGLHGLEDPMKYRFLTLSPIFYRWIIEIFGP
ncbi:15291_t:CDS:1, partial [Cetraspora pellucida]